MKKIILLALLGLSLNASAQIKVETDEHKIVQIGSFKEDQLSFALKGSDTLFLVLHYKNMEYSHLSDFKSIFIKGGEKTKEDFYSLLISCLDKEEKTTTKVSIDGKEIIIANGEKIMIFGSGAHSYTDLYSRKDIDKLFGK